MRPVQSVGRAGTPVIPAAWSQAPREVMAGTRTATVELRHPGADRGDFDTTTGTYPASPHPAYWTGSARIQVAPVFGGGQRENAGETREVISYLVAIDLSADDSTDELRLDDEVKVTGVDDNGDPSLVDRTLYVQSIARGSLAWERDLSCVDQLTPPATE